MTDLPASTAPAAAGHPLVQGRCPACGGSSLFLGSGGYLTCARLDCPQPDAATEVIADFWQARQHGAFTFCEQGVGHVTMTEFAKKSTEKVTALAHRREAVEYANEQKQRADLLASVLREILDEFRGMRDDPTGPVTHFRCAQVFPEQYERWQGVAAGTETRASGEQP